MRWKYTSIYRWQFLPKMAGTIRTRLHDKKIGINSYKNVNLMKNKKKQECHSILKETRDVTNKIQDP